MVRFSVMGSGAEQMLARVMNALIAVRESDGKDEQANQILADTLNEAEAYLGENEQFVDRLEARGDLS